MEGCASMLKKIYIQDDAFTRYFCEAEGDDDTVSVTVAPRANRGTDYNDDTNNVTVSPRNNRGTDYSSDDTDTDNEDTDNTDTNNEETTSTPENNTTDDNNGPSTDDEGTDYTSDASDDNTEDDETTGDEGTDDEDTDDEGSPDGPDTGDEGTDYTSAGDDNDAEDNTDNEESPENNDSESEEDTQEKENKFYMYKRYMYLYNTIDEFISRIQLVVKDDVTQNAVIKTVTHNLTDLKQNMFDYMTLRYKSASYIQILLYFETAISIIKLNFELLRNNKINLKQS